MSITQNSSHLGHFWSVDQFEAGRNETVRRNHSGQVHEEQQAAGFTPPRLQGNQLLLLCPAGVGNYLWVCAAWNQLLLTVLIKTMEVCLTALETNKPAVLLYSLQSSCSIMVRCCIKLALLLLQEPLCNQTKGKLLIHLTFYLYVTWQESRVIYDYVCPDASRFS